MNTLVWFTYTKQISRTYLDEHLPREAGAIPDFSYIIPDLIEAGIKIDINQGITGSLISYKDDPPDPHLPMIKSSYFLDYLPPQPFIDSETGGFISIKNRGYIKSQRGTYFIFTVELNKTSQS